jgi:hypothetical protein
MMPRVYMALEGAADLERALRELPKASMRRAVIQSAFRRAALPIITDANLKLPPAAQRVGIKVEIRAGLSRRQRSSRAPRANVIEMFLGVGPSRLSHLFEFGTSPRYTTGKGKLPAGLYRGSMKATPYLRPAWDAGNRALLDEFGRLLWKSIETTARRYALKQARLLRQSGARP